MRATFPAGRVSGAPKIRAMQIIADLEGTPRGPPRKTSMLNAFRDLNPRGRYGGCVGYFSFGLGERPCEPAATALWQTKASSPGASPHLAGGGWVNESKPGAEFQKTVNTRKAIHPPQWLCYGGLRGRVLKAVALAEAFPKTPYPPTRAVSNSRR